ncbi:2418_t:CDS:2, partial [Gigaspora rosea]
FGCNDGTSRDNTHALPSKIKSVGRLIGQNQSEELLLFRPAIPTKKNNYYAFDIWNCPETKLIHTRTKSKGVWAGCNVFSGRTEPPEAKLNAPPNEIRSKSLTRIDVSDLLARSIAISGELSLLTMFGCNDGTSRDNTHALPSEIKSVGRLIGQNQYEELLLFRPAIPTKKNNYYAFDIWNCPETKLIHTRTKSKGVWAGCNVFSGRTEPPEAKLNAPPNEIRSKSLTRIDVSDLLARSIAISGESSLLTMFGCNDGTSRDNTHALPSEIKSVGRLIGQNQSEELLLFRPAIPTKKNNYYAFDIWNCPETKLIHTRTKSKGVWAGCNVFSGRTEPPEAKLNAPPNEIRSKSLTHIDVSDLLARSIAISGESSLLTMFGCNDGTSRDNTHALPNEIKSVGRLIGQNQDETHTHSNEIKGCLGRMKRIFWQDGTTRDKTQCTPERNQECGDLLARSIAISGESSLLTM